jgi:hypothetical protein
MIDVSIWRRYDSLKGVQHKLYHPLGQPNGNAYSDCLSVWHVSGELTVRLYIV